MPYTVRHNPASGFIEVTFTGLMTGADLREVTTKAISLSKQEATTRFVIDAFAAELAALIYEIYDLPARQYVEEELSRETRAVVILPASEKARAAALFYETACRNRGWDVRTFSERQAAIDWLTGNSVPGKPDAG